MPKKKNYRQSLDKGTLKKNTVINLLQFMRSKGMSVEKFPDDILKPTKYRPKLEYWICKGVRNWEGLVVGFPGTIKDLLPINVDTAYLRLLLYPMLVLHRKMNLHYSREMPCLYIMGYSFNDIFLRKFSFLRILAPHVVVLSGDLKRWIERKKGHCPPKKTVKINERYFLESLCNMMAPEEGLRLPLSSGESIRLGLLSFEVPTVAGTKRNEQLDILSYDLDDHSLVAFEIKGPKPGRPQLENLFFQGMEHRNWVERNKMAVKFAFEGPTGSRIDHKKPVKLILGFCEENIPELFPVLKTQAQLEDSFQIEFCRLLKPLKDAGNVRIGSFGK